MRKIGCHLTISKGFEHAVKEAIKIDANTFQFFTRNPRGGKARELNFNDINKAKELMKQNNFGALFAHASYTMNLCSDKQDIREFAFSILRDDIQRLESIPESIYIFHPGSHVGNGYDKGIDYISSALNELVSNTTKSFICLEGMSGKGTEIGGEFEHLARIIDKVTYNEKIGICLDTCHLYSSGYDIVNDLEGVLNNIDNTIGLDRIKALHINDSMTELGSKKDRHEKLGLGTIGLEGIINFINHPKLKHISCNLETPNDIHGYKNEIAVLKEACK